MIHNYGNKFILNWLTIILCFCFFFNYPSVLPIFFLSSTRNVCHNLVGSATAIRTTYNSIHKCKHTIIINGGHNLDRLIFGSTCVFKLEILIATYTIFRLYVCMYTRVHVFCRSWLLKYNLCVYRSIEYWRYDVYSLAISSKVDHFYYTKLIRV